MLVLDTAEYDVRDRVDAVRDTFTAVSVPTDVSLVGTPGQIWARMEFWSLGSSSLFSHASTSFRLRRSRRHLALEGPPLVSLSLQTCGSGRFEQLDRRLLRSGGKLLLCDLSAPYDYGWDGDGGSCAFKVSHELLGLGPAQIRAATLRLEASPLYALARAHLAHLYRYRAELEDEGSGRVLGRSTLELLRALVGSAAGVPPPQCGSAAELRDRAVVYIDVHRANPALTPAAVAAAHNVSLRQLYKAFAQAHLSVEGTIVDLRLEAAHRELARPASVSPIVSTVARRCGFVNASHFARRFRQRYGLTPRQWQRQQA